MFPLERREKIVEYINKKNKASVKELSEYLNVSDVTIRRDLDELTKKGLAVKTHGGALSVYNKLSYEIPYEEKFSANADKKRKIGKAASKIVEDNDVIILDSGSTTFEIVRHLNRNNITVITNDIKIAMEVARKQGISLIVAGGILERPVYTLIGPTTEDFFSKVHVNKTFLGADAISLDFGLSNRTMQEVPIKRSMIEAAEEVILVADHTKLNKKVFAFLCAMDKIDKIIIDKISDEMKKDLIEKGIDVIIA